MKKTILLMTLAIASLCGSSYAQSFIKESIKIKEDQVPLAVKQTFKENFKDDIKDGYWQAYVEKRTEGGRTIAVPLWYSYTKREKKEKIEIRFSPQGQLTLVKGMERPQVSPLNTDSTGTETNKIG